MLRRTPGSWIWMLAIILNCLTVQAQETTPLDTRGQSSVANAALTALPAKTESTRDRSAMFIRIAEIEIHRAYLTEYLNILQEEAAASVKLEPGVISIFPMMVKNDSTQIRIVEIYADRNAYQHHLTTPHFQKYKTSTLQMVKSLKLVDMTALDIHTMGDIFRKF